MPDHEVSSTHLLVLLRHTQPMTPAPSSGMKPAARKDLALVRSALSGDPQATHDLAERLAVVPAMVRARHRRLGTPLPEEELQDVVQETLVTLWSKLDRFSGRSVLETWVYGVVVHEVYRGLRRHYRGGRVVEVDETRLLATPDPAAEPDLDGYRIVHESLHAIGPPGSDIIRLKHFSELTFEEIADELSISVNTVKTRYYRSVDRMRGLLRAFWREEAGR